MTLFDYPPVAEARRCLEANGFGVTTCRTERDHARRVTKVMVGFEIRDEQLVRGEFPTIEDAEIIDESPREIGPVKVIEIDVVKIPPRPQPSKPKPRTASEIVDEIMDKLGVRVTPEQVRAWQRIQAHHDRQAAAMERLAEEKRQARAKGKAQPDASDAVRGLYVNKIRPKPKATVDCLACEEGVCKKHTGGGWSL